MNKIYDNGYCLLGKVEDILNYVNHNAFDDTTKDMIDELRLYDNNSIVCVNYDNAMGCIIEEFREDSILWKIGESE